MFDCIQGVLLMFFLECLQRIDEVVKMVGRCHDASERLHCPWRTVAEHNGQEAHLVDAPRAHHPRAERSPRVRCEIGVATIALQTLEGEGSLLLVDELLRVLDPDALSCS